MKIEKYIPSDLLKPFVQTYLVIESDNGMQNRILPSSSVVLSFRIKGRVSSLEEFGENSIPLLGISGIRRFPRLIRYSPGAAALLVIFKEGGATAFFKEPMHEIFGMNLSLDNLTDRIKILETEEKLFEANNHRQRISLIERFLLSELKGIRPDMLVLETIRKIRAAKGDLRIGELLKGLPISRDSYEKKFRRIIGTTPKQFSEIVRMRNLIDQYSPNISLTETAYQAGYYDQAHFIKEFKSFTGLTPKEFFKSKYW
ncbi:DNA-binding helix-turn-helix protein [Leptospira broomii serovar Hurstbridge str. 5399]|uniref:DNA-binding helix-turn-helix protein n=1 Tax=Leptospira broomii serovar Hurstbridge str. 5399 TaxID=1049789 RepID=T0GCQ8_9LEPT|nr:helix-turn-helix transcriptional regulator [Leptospira broomii]EQA43198.1 DNA-binding helix-turn-helix protein [Leptospira broomii serovar Hurstbridge str. 5399]